MSALTKFKSVYREHGLTEELYTRAQNVHEAVIDGGNLDLNSIAKIAQQHGFPNLQTFHETLVRCHTYNICHHYLEDMFHAPPSETEDWDLRALKQWYYDKTLTFYPEDEDELKHLDPVEFSDTFVEFLRGFRADHLISCGW